MSHDSRDSHHWATRPPRPGAEHVVPMFSEQQIAERIAQMGDRISETYRDVEQLTLVAVMIGALQFCADLVRRIERPVELALVDASSYGNATRSSGNVSIDLGRLGDDLSGQHVLVLEDIVDSGRTLAALGQRLAALGAESVRTAVLMDKKVARAVPMRPDFVGFEVEPDAFVVGYGVDYAGRYRNLPFIGRVIDPETR